MDVYKRVAGVGPTIDNAREYLLWLYARAYDALDGELLSGYVVERPLTPAELARVRAHFARMIELARRYADKKTVDTLRRLRDVTLAHATGKINHREYLKRLRAIMRSYGIRSHELRRIEERINRLEALVQSKRVSTQPRPPGGATRPTPHPPNVFNMFDRALERLVRGGR